MLDVNNRLGATVGFGMELTWAGPPAADGIGSVKYFCSLTKTSPERVAARFENIEPRCIKSDKDPGDLPDVYYALEGYFDGKGCDVPLSPERGTVDIHVEIRR